MAGVKGRSGGSRAGAGRKPKEASVSGIKDPLDFLQKVWAGEIEANAGQIRAASAALPFMHPKVEGKKKPEGEGKPGSGKYAVRSGPRLVASR